MKRPYPTSELDLSQALAKMRYEPKFTGYTPMQKAMVIDELEHALAMCKALTMVKIRNE